MKDNLFWAAVAAIVLLGIAALVSPAQEPTLARPQETARETDWSGYLAERMGGEAEHRLPDGSRVDILTKTTAWEVEWPEKWPQSIGQAVYYGALTNRRPGVLLLMGKGDNATELKYYLRAALVCQRLNIKLATVRVDKPEADP